MHPMGWDAFGLPAEQHAKQTGTHPRTTTEKNIANFRRQIKMLGFSYDWDRELATTDVGYFRWTQFIFSCCSTPGSTPGQQKGRPIAELPIPEEVAAEGEAAVGYRDEHRLAYQLEAPVNWCPALGTVLANEEVHRRRERARRASGGPHAVAAMDAADHRLRRPPGTTTSTGSTGPRASSNCSATGSAGAPGRRSISSSARIGERRRHGRLAARVSGLADGPQPAGFPEKPDEDVLAHLHHAARHALRRDLHGAGPGASACRAADAARRRPRRCGRIASGRPARATWTAPIWPRKRPASSPARYADQSGQRRSDADLDRRLRAGQLRHRRDHGRAGPRRARLRVRQEIRPADRRAWSIRARRPAPRDELLAGRVAFIADGTAINAALRRPAHGRVQAADRRRPGRKGLGRAAVNYKLRDWLFSRQHFWGEPFPDPARTGRRRPARRPIRALRPEDLPVDLPRTDDLRRGPRAPRAAAGQGPGRLALCDARRQAYKRETNTMPQWAGSCWYYLRFLDPKNDQALVDREMEQAWMPVDLYVGGAEHAVLHLLYARFWHKVLFDRGYVSTRRAVPANWSTRG